jgi:hypothetical protein
MGQGDSPWGLAYALSTPNGILPGHTLYLRGGTYQGAFVSTLIGVTIKAYPGEQVIIDGSITVNGAGCTFEGLEIYSSAWTTRQSAFSGSNPADIPGKEAYIVGTNGTSTTIRNCTIHDVRQGVLCSADGLIVEDCHFYNNGWLGTDRAHGHGVYLTNVTTPARVERCIFGPAYDEWGVHAFSDSGKAVANITIRDNVHIGKILICWSTGQSDNLTIAGNETWRGMLEVGQASNDHHGITIEDNYLVGAGVWEPLITRRLKDCSITGNTLIAEDGDLLTYVTPNTDPPISQVWADNQWHGQGVLDEVTPRTYAAWRALYGLDADSTQADDVPTENRIRIIDDQIVVVYNWQELASVPAPIAGTYTNAQNPVESVTLEADDPLPMTGWTVATPIAGAGPLATWDSRFGVFLVDL